MLPKYLTCRINWGIINSIGNKDKENNMKHLNTQKNYISAIEFYCTVRICDPGNQEAIDKAADRVVTAIGHMNRAGLSTSMYDANVERKFYLSDGIIDEAITLHMKDNVLKESLSLV